MSVSLDIYFPVSKFSNIDFHVFAYGGRPLPSLLHSRTDSFWLKLHYRDSCVAMANAALVSSLQLETPKSMTPSWQWNLELELMRMHRRQKVASETVNPCDGEADGEGSTSSEGDDATVNVKVLQLQPLPSKSALQSP